MAALRFRFAPPTASHGAGGNHALTNNTDHSVGAGHRCPAEVGIGGRHIVEALGVAPVNVVLDESLELPFKIAGQEAVFQ